MASASSARAPRKGRAKKAPEGAQLALPGEHGGDEEQPSAALLSCRAARREPAVAASSHDPVHPLRRADGRE